MNQLTHPVIDVHTHIYPDKIAEKATQSVSAFYSLEMGRGGTVCELLDKNKLSPITHSIVHSVAVKPENVESINNFIAGQSSANESLIGFGTLHPDTVDPEAEINRIISLGLRGIKMHHDIQGVNMDDPKMMRIYEIVEGRLPMILHCGDYRYDYTHPRRIKNVIKAFPHLTLDTAHFGGWSIPDLALEYLEHETCFLDISSSMSFIGLRRTKELISAYGVDRILFGSDFPMFDPVEEFEKFRSIDLTDTEFENITYRNALRFLGTESIDQLSAPLPI